MIPYHKTFYGQIVVNNASSAFLAAGDSGSLLVEDVGTNPPAIGLLFASSNTSAFANPIGQVLSFLGATMVGNLAPPPPMAGPVLQWRALFEVVWLMKVGAPQLKLPPPSNVPLLTATVFGGLARLKPSPQ